MSKSAWSKGRLSVRLSHVCETDCNRFLLDKESTGCTDRCNRTKITEHANSASAPAWEADVLLNYEHLFFVQRVDGEERFQLLFSVQREGAAGETQTCGILPKRQMLYPITLRADKRRQRHESLTARQVDRSSTRRAVFEFALCIDRIARRMLSLSSAVR